MSEICIPVPDDPIRAEALRGTATGCAGTAVAEPLDGPGVAFLGPLPAMLGSFLAPRLPVAIPTTADIKATLEVAGYRVQPHKDGTATACTPDVSVAKVRSFRLALTDRIAEMGGELVAYGDHHTADPAYRRGVVRFRCGGALSADQSKAVPAHGPDGGQRVEAPLFPGGAP